MAREARVNALIDDEGSSGDDEDFGSSVVDSNSALDEQQVLSEELVVYDSRRGRSSLSQALPCSDSSKCSMRDLFNQGEQVLSNHSHKQFRC